MRWANPRPNHKRECYPVKPIEARHWNLKSTIIDAIAILITKPKAIILLDGLSSKMIKREDRTLIPLCYQ